MTKKEKIQQLDAIHSLSVEFVKKVETIKENKESLISNFKGDEHTIWSISNNLFDAIEMIKEIYDNVYKCEIKHTTNDRCEICIKYSKDMHQFFDNILKTSYHLQD